MGTDNAVTLGQTVDAVKNEVISRHDAEAMSSVNDSGVAAFVEEKRKLDVTYGKQNEPPVLPAGDSMTTADAMQAWRKTMADPVALAQTLTYSQGVSMLERAKFFISVANDSVNKIIIDELARLYEIERNFEEMKVAFDAAVVQLEKAQKLGEELAANVARVQRKTEKKPKKSGS